MFSRLPVCSLPNLHVDSFQILCLGFADTCSSGAIGSNKGVILRAERRNLKGNCEHQSFRQNRHLICIPVRFRRGRSAYRKPHFSARLRPLAALNASEFRKLQAEKQKEAGDEEDDDLCPVECVKEFKTNAELAEILETSKQTNALVVVDFYRTACGSCKYIEQGFIKLCKGAGDDEASVCFLKHNVMDEYEEQSEVAERLKIKVVPLFHFYKNGKLVEAFPTREKTKILDTICKYTSSSLKNCETTI